MSRAMHDETYRSEKTDAVLPAKVHAHSKSKGQCRTDGQHNSRLLRRGDHPKPKEAPEVIVPVNGGGWGVVYSRAMEKVAAQ